MPVLDNAHSATVTIMQNGHYPLTKRDQDTCAPTCERRIHECVANVAYQPIGNRALFPAIVRYAEFTFYLSDLVHIFLGVSRWDDISRKLVHPWNTTSDECFVMHNSRYWPNPLRHFLHSTYSMAKMIPLSTDPQYLTWFTFKSFGATYNLCCTAYLGIQVRIYCYGTRSKSRLYYWHTS
jgi:hypothetical protein